MRIIKGRARVTAPNWPQFEQKGISPEVALALANLHAGLVLAALEEPEERSCIYSRFGKSLLELTDAVDEMLKNAK
ncbi:MAG: hypothetical protein PHE79_08535 [Eubacteriales bacterium]|nr:hypothetical protein [Eubacteriales bacterium]